MPTIPLPQESDRIGATTAVTAGRVAPLVDARGVQVSRFGQALQSAGFTTARIAADLQEDLHVAAVKEGQALAEERIAEIDRAYTNTVGKAATGDNRENAWARIQEQLDSIEGGLKHEVERDLFRQTMSRRMVDVGIRWGRHEDRQVRAYELGAGEAVLQAKIDAARRQEPQDAPGSPQGRQGAAAPPDMLQSVVAEARSLAGKLGLGPEQALLFVRESTTKVHAGRVEDLIEAGRVSGAKSYLAGIDKKQVDPDTMHSLRGLVRRGTVKEEGSTLAVKVRNELFAKHRQRLRDPGRTEPMRPVPDADAWVTAAQSQLQTLAEGNWITLEVRDAAMAEVAGMGKLQSNGEAVRANDIREEGEKWLRENAPASVESMPARLYQDAEGLGVLDELRAVAGGQGRHTDPEAWVQAETLTDFQLRDFSAAELARAFRGRLDKQHMAQLESRWRRARGVATPEDDSVVGTPDRVRRSFTEALDLPQSMARWRKDDVLDLFRFEEEVQKRVSDAERRGEPIKGEPLQKIIDAVVLDVAQVHTGRGFFWLGSPFEDPEMVATMTAEEILGARRFVDTDDEVAVIPGADRGAIIAELRRAGKPLTEENLVLEWRMALRKRRDITARREARARRGQR